MWDRPASSIHIPVAASGFVEIAACLQVCLAPYVGYGAALSLVPNPFQRVMSSGRKWLRNCSLALCLITSITPSFFFFKFPTCWRGPSHPFTPLPTPPLPSPTLYSCAARRRTPPTSRLQIPLSLGWPPHFSWETTWTPNITRPFYRPAAHIPEMFFFSWCVIVWLLVILVLPWHRDALLPLFSFSFQGQRFRVRNKTTAVASSSLFNLWVRLWHLHVPLNTVYVSFLVLNSTGWKFILSFFFLFWVLFFKSDHYCD